jgi:hypothetical protein
MSKSNLKLRTLLAAAVSAGVAAAPESKPFKATAVEVGKT